MRARFLVFWVLSATLVQGALAQDLSATPALPTPPAELQPLKLSTVYRFPAVTIAGSTITEVSDDGIVRGSVTIENHEAALLTDVRYQLQLLGPELTAAPGTLIADTAPSYDRIVAGDDVSLLPESTKTVPFEYHAPPLPAGDYRLRLRARLPSGRLLGWQDVPLVLKGDSATALALQQGPLVASGAPVYPGEGVLVDPGAALRALARLSVHVGGTPTSSDRPRIRRGASVTVTPVVSLYRWDRTGEPVLEETRPSVTVTTQRGADLDIPLEAPSVPDGYVAVIRAQDQGGTTVGNELEYRFTVKGPSAKVVSALFNEFQVTKGKRLAATVAAVGPADRTGSVRALATVDVLDGDVPVASRELAPITLDTNVQMSTVQFVLPREITLPGLRVTLRGDQDAVLDQYETHAVLSLEELRAATGRVAAHRRFSWETLQYYSPWISIAFILVPLLLKAVFKKKRASPQSPPPPAPENPAPTPGPGAPPLIASFLLTVVLFGALLSASRVRAQQGTQVQKAALPWNTGASMFLFINEPREAQRVPPSLTTRFDVLTAGSLYRPHTLALTVRHAGQGEAEEPDHLPNAVTDGTLSWTVPSPHCVEDTCAAVHNFIATTALQDPLPEEETTVQFEALLQVFRPTYQAARDVWNVGVQRAAPRNQAACETIDVPETVATSQSFPAVLTLRNIGSAAWETDDTPHALGSQNPEDNETWGPGRVALPAAVAPGETVKFAFPATAPKIVGTVPFSWKMVEEAVEWFGETCEKTITVTGGR